MFETGLSKFFEYLNAITLFMLLFLKNECRNKFPKFKEMALTMGCHEYNFNHKV